MTTFQEKRRELVGDCIEFGMKTAAGGTAAGHEKCFYFAGRDDDQLDV